MTLGIITKPQEESFIKARNMGLDFLEFTINKGDDDKSFLADLADIQRWIRQYGVAVGSIGRWKAETIHPDGTPVAEELALAYRLIEACETLSCPVYVCGCNYSEELSYFENCQAAIGLFQHLLDHGKKHGVQIATYNCRKGTFVHSPMAWTMIHGYLKDLKIKYDPSHSIYAGTDYLKETDDWGSRFAHVHLKGSLMNQGKRVDDPPAGIDMTDWPAFLSILMTKGYNGGLSIEPHSDIWKGDKLDDGIAITIRYMNSILPKRSKDFSSTIRNSESANLLKTKESSGNLIAKESATVLAANKKTTGNPKNIEAATNLAANKVTTGSPKNIEAATNLAANKVTTGSPKNIESSNKLTASKESLRACV